MGPSEFHGVNKNRKNGKSLYRGAYVEPDRISATEPDKMHKVIYCVASLD